MLRAHPNPRQAAQARQETRAAVRDLASIAAGIARALLNPVYGTVTSDRPRKINCVARTRYLMVTRILAVLPFNPTFPAALSSLSKSGDAIQLAVSDFLPEPREMDNVK